MTTEAEIAAGLVLHLDPDTLANRGGSYTCKDEQRAQGGHFFLCLSVDAGSSRWLPLYSNPGDGRAQVAANGRTGHQKWTGGTWYWHRDQVWTAPHAAVVAADVAGVDMSSRGSRNLLDESNLPSLDGSGS